MPLSLRPELHEHPEGPRERRPELRHVPILVRLVAKPAVSTIGPCGHFTSYVASPLDLSFNVETHR
jgi:hypothetical protein